MSFKWRWDFRGQFRAWNEKSVDFDKACLFAWTWSPELECRYHAEGLVEVLGFVQHFGIMLRVPYSINSTGAHSL